MKLKERLQLYILLVLRSIYRSELGRVLWVKLMPHVFLHKEGLVWFWDEYTRSWDSDIGFNMIRSRNDWLPLIYERSYYHECPEVAKQ